LGENKEVRRKTMTDKSFTISLWVAVIILAIAVALTYVGEAHSTNYEGVWLYYNQGNAHYKAGEFDEAIEDYNKAIGIESEFTEAYNNLGNAYGRKGDYDNAIINYTKAIRINPRFGKAYVNLGYIYYLKGNYKLSCRYYERACGIGYCRGIGWVNSQDLCD
jgi:tetratricopeptide (TPR) repeat protein